nr:MAG TPA: hypothetical protein [Bacteriophage sp.]
MLYNFYILEELLESSFEMEIIEMLFPESLKLQP